MNDRLLVGALLSGDPEALDTLYDTHASRVYAYCWFLVRNHEIAQVALRDTFVVAEARIEELPDSARLGAWLYALARNECGRRDATWVSGPDVPLASPDQSDADLRMVAWRAVLGLTPLRRELLELHVRHRLHPADLADILELGAKDVPDQIEEARTWLERAVVAEILAQRQPYECAERCRILRDRRGDLTDGLRDRLLRHARACAECAAYGPRTVSAPKVYALLPWPEPPATLRGRVMSCFTDSGLASYRSFVADRAGPFGPAGFPVHAAGFGQRHPAGPPTGADRAAGRGRGPILGFAAATLTVVLAGTGVHWLGGRFEAGYPAAGRAASSDPGAARSGGPVVPGHSAGGVAAQPGSTGADPAEQGRDGPDDTATFPLGAQLPALPPTALPLFPPYVRPGTDGQARRGDARARPSRAPSPKPLPGVPAGGPGAAGAHSKRRQQTGRPPASGGARDHGRRGGREHGKRSPAPSPSASRSGNGGGSPTPPPPDSDGESDPGAGSGGDSSANPDEEPGADPAPDTDAKGKRGHGVPTGTPPGDGGPPASGAGDGSTPPPPDPASAATSRLSRPTDASRASGSAVAPDVRSSSRYAAPARARSLSGDDPS